MSTLKDLQLNKVKEEKRRKRSLEGNGSGEGSGSGEEIEVSTQKEETTREVTSTETSTSSIKVKVSIPSTITSQTMTQKVRKRTIKRKPKAITGKITCIKSTKAACAESIKRNRTKSTKRTHAKWNRVCTHVKGCRGKTHIVCTQVKRHEEKTPRKQSRGCISQKKGKIHLFKRRIPIEMNITNSIDNGWTDWIEEQNGTSHGIKQDVWRKAKNNRWYQWAYYMARKQTQDECIICASHKPKLKIVPHPYRLENCKEKTNLTNEVLCPA